MCCDSSGNLSLFCMVWIERLYSGMCGSGECERWMCDGGYV